MGIDAEFVAYLPIENLEHAFSLFSPMLHHPGSEEQPFTEIDLPGGKRISIPGSDCEYLPVEYFPCARSLTIWQLVEEITSMESDCYDIEHIDGNDWHSIEVTMHMETDRRCAALRLSSNDTDAALLMSLPEVYTRLVDAAEAADAAFCTIASESPPMFITDGDAKSISIDRKKLLKRGEVQIDAWVDAVLTWRERTSGALSD